MSFGMHQQRAAYSCTALVGTNKAGKLKPDAKGYYTLVLGALDVHNSMGAFYPLNSAKHVFESSSSLMRRIANGNCRGECGHPKPLPGMSTRDFLQRVMTIEETNVCCHFRNVRLETQEVKDKNGRPVVAVIGEVKPSGPKGEFLKESLENEDENVCFSVRSLTNDHMAPNGVLQKNIKTIVTWDWVVEPGISVANKYSSPALEAFNDLDFNEAQLRSVQENQGTSGLSMESHGGLDVGQVLSDLGWSTPNRSALPPSLQW
jgi:hypothetical protein